MTALRAFHNDQSIKGKYIKRMEDHIAADELMRGMGWDEEGEMVHGCAVGCTFNAYNHERGPIEIGVPAEVMMIEDALFEEGTPDYNFPLNFLHRIPVGADLSRIPSLMVHWCLNHQLYGRNARTLDGPVHGHSYKRTQEILDYLSRLCLDPDNAKDLARLKRLLDSHMEEREASLRPSTRYIRDILDFLFNMDLGVNPRINSSLSKVSAARSIFWGGWRGHQPYWQEARSHLLDLLSAAPVPDVVPS